jgi:hypothetical protein
MLVGHAAPSTLHRRLQRLGELHQQPHAFFVTRDVARDDQRVVGSDEQLRRLGDGP